MLQIQLVKPNLQIQSNLSYKSIQPSTKMTPFSHLIKPQEEASTQLVCPLQSESYKRKPYFKKIDSIYNQRENNSDYTPDSLWEELKIRKPQHKYEVKDYTFQQQEWSPRPQYSIITKWNPAFRMLEEMKRQRLARLTRSGLGWHDKTLWEEESTGELYRIPDETGVVDTDESQLMGKRRPVVEKNSSKEEYNQTIERLESEYKLNMSKLMTSWNKIQNNSSSNSIRKNRHLNNRTSFGCKDLIDQIAETSMKEEDDSNEQSSSINIPETVQQPQTKDAEIQTEGYFQMIQAPSNLSHMTFEQLSQEMMKHLKLIQDINNSQSYHFSLSSFMKSSINEVKNQEENPEKQEVQVVEKSKTDESYGEQSLLMQGIQSVGENNNQENQQNSFSFYLPKTHNYKINEAIFSSDSSKYLKSAESDFILTPEDKIKLLQKFNKEQTEMFDKLFESIISFKSFDDKSRTDQDNSFQLTKNKSQFFHNHIYRYQTYRSQLSFSSSSQSQSQGNQESNIQHSSINSQPTDNTNLLSGSFFKKSTNELANLNTSNEQESHNVQNQRHKCSESQFQNLQVLMRDRQLKESIIDSNQQNSSFNSESFLSIDDSEIIEKFNKLNPNALKLKELQ